MNESAQGDVVSMHFPDMTLRWEHVPDSRSIDLRLIVIEGDPRHGLFRTLTSFGLKAEDVYSVLKLLGFSDWANADVDE